MDRLRELEILVTVAETGSFAGAAAHLNISAPAVTRAMAALELRLGVPLIQRTTRRLRFTETGQRFLETARRLVAEFEAAEIDVRGEITQSQGHLVVTAPIGFGRMAVTPVLSGFLSAHPRVTASLVMLDRVVNLVEEGIDVGIRFGALPDSSLIARKIGEVARPLVASPTYLAHHGMPKAPQDLGAHRVIRFTGLMPSRDWPHTVDARTVHLTLTPHLELNDAAAAISAAEAGEGITIAPSYMVGEAIRSGRLVSVLETFWLAPTPVHLIHPASRLVARKVLAFMDYAAPRLRHVLDQAAFKRNRLNADNLIDYKFRGLT